MNLDNKLIFFFSALGAFNSIVLSIYFLLFARPKKGSNYFLGGLLIALSIRVWKSLFFYYNPSLSKVYLQIGLSACFLIGPFLYLYIKSKYLKKGKINKLTNTHLLFTVVLILCIGIIYPYKNNIDLWVDYFYYIINLQWLVYIIISAFLLKPVIHKLMTRDHKLDYNEVWLVSVFFGVLCIWIAYNTASYTSYIVGALSYSFVFYLTGLLIYHKRKKEFVVSMKKEKYANTQIEQTEVNHLLEKIESTLVNEELYKNPNITMPLLAKKINIRPQLLSQLLNNNLSKSFSLFINEYRIEEAKRLLKEKPHLKIETIAEECGYNSNSTFYAAFKKITQTTPSKYIAQESNLKMS
ncbi:transcription regulator, AraC family [Dokdonia sp. MED134]|nr:transcription regulator, AraC family [Dokdonia sp. MED134]